MIRHLPLFVILLIAYNLMVFAGPAETTLAQNLFQIGMMSGGLWVFDVHHLYMTLGVIVLYLEIVKATRTGTASVIDHSLSTLVFVVFVVEFLIMPGCATSTFFLLALMSLLDVIAGFTVSIVSARRDFGLGEHH